MFQEIVDIQSSFRWFLSVELRNTAEEIIRLRIFVNYRLIIKCLCQD